MIFFCAQISHKGLGVCSFGAGALPSFQFSSGGFIDERRDWNATDMALGFKFIPELVVERQGMRRFRSAGGWPANFFACAQNQPLVHVKRTYRKICHIVLTHSNPVILPCVLLNVFKLTFLLGRYSLDMKTPGSACDAPGEDHGLIGSQP